MDKVKQETFSNFHYEIIKSIDDRCADVKCTYTYKGKNLTHYFSYAKSGNKPSSYYINKAKADMNKIVASKSEDNVAKKDLNGKKATFFRRHKKPILIATTAVLVAGIATAATLVALKYLNKPDPEAVTEAEIDKYTKFPDGVMSVLYDEETIGNILQNSIAKITSDGQSYSYNINKLSTTIKDHLTDITIKRMGSYQSKIPDPFDYMGGDRAETVEDSGLAANETLNSFSDSDSTPSYNDMTEYYTNESFKTRYLNTVYAKVDIKKSPTLASTHIVNTYDDVIENVGTKTVYKSDNHITHKKDKDNKEVVFENGSTTLDGVKTQDLNSILFDGTENDYEDCESYMNEEIADQVIFFGELDFLISEDGPTFYKKSDTEVYAISWNESKIRVAIPSVYFPSSPTSEGGVEGYIQPIRIWHFVKDEAFAAADNDGWLLKSYALDYSVYTNYNDRYQKLPHDISVNKNKGFVEFNYGNKSSATDDVAKLSVPSELKKDEVKAPSLPVNNINLSVFGWEYEFHIGGISLSDITIPNRISTGKNSYVAVSTSPLYIPTAEELEKYSSSPVDVCVQMLIDSVYFEEDKQEQTIQLHGGKPVQKYNIEPNDYFYEWEDDYYGGYYICPKNSGTIDKPKYLALGHFFNVVVTYDYESLSMKTPDQVKEGKKPDNWILIPSSISFTLVK